jgi:hypothetical protein
MFLKTKDLITSSRKYTKRLPPPMPKPKAKISKLKSSRENTPVEAKEKDSEKKEEKTSPELPWSDWIWEPQQTLYYRARLGTDSLSALHFTQFPY